MNRFSAVLMAVVCMAWAGAAEARIATLTVHGQLVSQGPGPEIDPNLSLGDPVTASMSFDPNQAMQLGDTGYYLAKLATLEVSSDGFPMPFLDIVDGFPFASQWFMTQCVPYDPDCSIVDAYQEIAAPAVIYKGNQVFGLVGASAPSDSAYGPDYDLGSGIDWFGNCIRDSVGAPYVCDGSGIIQLSNQFSINYPTYLSEYYTQGFGGVWDFDGARIAGIPEPGTWALMIVGFGGVGAMLRANRRRLAPITA